MYNFVSICFFIPSNNEIQLKIKIHVREDNALDCLASERLI